MSQASRGAREATVGQDGMPTRVRRQARPATFGPDKRERNDVLLAFGEKLRVVRVEAGLSQEALAVRCFMARYQISALERGVRAPDLPALLVLEQRLGVSTGELTEGLEAPVRRVGTAQVRDLIARQPGISDDALAASLGLPFWYAVEIALYLQSTGEIAHERTGWRPAPQ